MKTVSVISTILIQLVLLVAGVRHADAQVSTTRGQDIVPVFEGWRKAPDGSYRMFFGYFSRNSEEQIDVPVGADNSFDPPAADRGQPTHFYPKRQWFVFSVAVPKDWGQKDLVWSLTAHGKTEKAYGSLLDIYEVDNELIAKNMGAGSFGLMLANKDVAPTITVSPGEAKAALPDGTVRLTATVHDDGVPPPPPARTQGAASRGGASQGVFLNIPVPAEPRRPPGLSVQWIHYRGPGTVKFTPTGYQQSENGGSVAVTASFSDPGTYVIRAIANDSLLYAVQDVTVVVTKP